MTTTTTTTNHLPGSGSALCHHDHTAMRHDKGAAVRSAVDTVRRKMKNGAKKKTQQEFQREPITVQ
jgi:hypothetical protein